MDHQIECDLIVSGAKVLGGPSTSVPADAVAVLNGRIIAVGDSRELSRLPARHRVEAPGQVLAPGFVDAHSHLLLYSIALRHLDCRPAAARGIDDLLQRIASAPASEDPDQWIWGWGFADYKVKERRFPTLKELDEVAPDRPVAIVHASWHTAVVNSAGLRKLGIEDRTPDPPGGKIERDRVFGRPNGLLHEAAMASVSFDAMIRDFAAIGADEQLGALARGCAEYVRLGITLTCDAMCVPPFLALYREAERQGALPLRVVTMPYLEQSEEVLEWGLRSGFGSESLKIGAVKITADGSLSGRTAAVSAPFTGGSDLGILFHDQETLDRMVLAQHSKGNQIAIHAIGDRAVDQVIRAYRRVIPPGRNTRRHRIEHAGILSRSLIDALGELDLVVAVQPRMLHEQGDGFARSCGEDRLPWVYPYRALVETGLHVAGSSDCPVVSPDPLLGMRDAVMRQTEEGRVLAPEQRLNPEQAFAMFTREAAYSLFEEGRAGEIAVGRHADLVLLSGDPLETPAAEWGSQLRVLMTIVRGETVFAERGPSAGGEGTARSTDA